MANEGKAERAQRWLVGHARAAEVERELKRRAGLDPARAVALSLEMIEAAWSLVQSPDARRVREREDAPVRELWRKAKLRALSKRPQPHGGSTAR